MSSLNPLSSVLLQSVELQRTRSAEKQRAIREAKKLDDEVADRDDEMEHQVENTEDAMSIHDDTPDGKRGKNGKKRHANGEETGVGEAPRLDITA